MISSKCTLHWIGHKVRNFEKGASPEVNGIVEIVFYVFHIQGVQNIFLGGKKEKETTEIPMDNDLVKPVTAKTSHVIVM